MYFNITFVGNTTDTALSLGTPAAINTGALASAQSAVRFRASSIGRATYDATKQIYVSIHGTLSYAKQGGGIDAYTFYLYKNGVLLPESNVEIQSGGDSAEGTISLNYGTLMTQNDYIEVYVENPLSNDDMLVKDLQLVIRE